MAFMVESFFSGCISKVVNDGKDYLWANIKEVINDKNDCNLSTKIYRVIENVLNIVTDKKFKDSDILYYAIEKIFNEFRDNGDTLEAVRCGLSLLDLDVSDQKCENFIEQFYKGICQDEDLYKRISLILHKSGIKINQEEFQQLNEKIERNHTELSAKMDSMAETFNGNWVNKENITTKDLKFQNNKKMDYVKIWNSRLFLHLHNEENPITLAEAFIMPRYHIHRKIEHIDFFIHDNLKNVIDKYIKYNRTSDMLITGVPGMGKSSIVSWIANEYKYDDSIIILRFRDWEHKELEEGLLKAICNTLDCKRKDLENKIIVLDGFDEMKPLDRRDELLKEFFYDIKDYENFKFIITSRPAYIEVHPFSNILELKQFDINKVDAFYRKITKNELNNVENIESNLEVLGIPVILYMAIMSNVDISEKPTKPELYERIFAEKGGIFDRFYYEGVQYSIGVQVLREPENIRRYLKFLKDIASLMCEKGRLSLYKEDCPIPELKFQKSSVSVLEFPIKHLFESNGNNIEFIHKSIYDFFVAEYIYTTVYGFVFESKKELARILGKLLRMNELSVETFEFLKYKIIRNDNTNEVFSCLNETFSLICQDKSLIFMNDCHQTNNQYVMNVFINMLGILRLWENKVLKFDSWICNYLKFYYKFIDLSNVDFSGSVLNGAVLVRANLRNANFRNTHLIETNFNYAELEDAHLVNADLTRAHLRNAKLDNADFSGSNLTKADFRGSDLKNAKFEGSNLSEAIISENQIQFLETKYCLDKTKIFTNDLHLIYYEDYCKR